MKEILIAVKNKIAMNLGNATYVCANSDYRVVFDFDAEWEEHPVKTARFKYNGMYQEVVFSGSVCNMPVIRDARLIYIGVYAGNLQTSTPAVVHASQSILSGDAAHDAPAEDVYNQLVALVESGVLKGPDGKSAYELAVENGYIGSETDWLASLHGAPGKTPVYGVDYGTPDQITGIAGKAAEILKLDVNQIKNDISNLRFGDPYDGVDLTAKFAGEISGYSDPGAWIRARIRANNFDGIHVNDYLPFVTTNGLNFKARILGIDPYYEYGYFAVGHHIDFICEELWPTLHPINPVNYNNGLIPTENVTSDGTATQYVLTKPMYGVEKVTLSGTDLTGCTYDKDTYTLTFSTAPAAGTMVVTGTGSKHPWLASDAYLYVNSLAGHVANGTGVNPAIKRVDYTNDGIYHYLPDWLKAVIIEKRFLLNERYSTSGVLSDENSWSWVNLGKLWFPTEVEVYGCPVWGSKGGHGLGGSIQYPYFVGNMRRMKKRNGGRHNWWLLSPYTDTTYWCYVHNSGYAASYVASYDLVAAPVCFRIG